MLPYRVLAVDDELLQLKIVSQRLLSLGFLVDTTQNSDEAVEILRAKEFDVVLLDVQMPGAGGFEILDLIRKLEDPPEVIMHTLDDSLESGIAAMRAGAYDYVIKPASPEALETTITKAAEKRRLERQNSNLRDFVKSKAEGTGSVTLPVQASAAMREITRQADSVAPLSSTILITGESGTGKDVLARYIHITGSRGGSPMISVNCGAMPETLFESEFFGYEKGAFTGADATKRGLLEAADGSTLFLDEIGEMPLTLQVKLLRFLESGWFRRVGGTRDLFADARIISATNRDLTEAVRDGTFRADLYYRLNVIELNVPPLRDRDDDLAALIDYFLDIYRAQFQRPELSFTDVARQKLTAYQYPGNIRELKNIVERAAALATGNKIEDGQIVFPHGEATRKDILTPDNPVNDVIAAGPVDFYLSSGAKITTLEDLERRYIHTVLAFAKNNRERAANLLGISERTLYRRLRDSE